MNEAIQTSAALHAVTSQFTDWTEATACADMLNLGYASHSPSKKGNCGPLACSASVYKGVIWEDQHWVIRRRVQDLVNRQTIADLQKIMMFDSEMVDGNDRRAWITQYCNTEGSG